MTTKVFLRDCGDEEYVLFSRVGWKHPLQAKGLDILDQRISFLCHVSLLGSCNFRTCERKEEKAEGK